MMKLLVSTVTLVAALFAGGCHGSECEGDCECRGTECQCPSSGDCLVDCAADCDLACTGSGDCDFVCGPDCAASCPGSGMCLLDVGAASSVSCTGSGGCDVACHGDCTVDCPGSGVCVARCAEGAVCTFDRCSGEVVECPGRVQVCNGSCPP
jgi:hypothetical protein